MMQTGEPVTRSRQSPEYAGSVNWLSSVCEPVAETREPSSGSITTTSMSGLPSRAGVRELTR